MCDSSFARKDTLRRYAWIDTSALDFDADVQTDMLTMGVRIDQKFDGVYSRPGSHRLALSQYHHLTNSRRTSSLSFNPSDTTAFLLEQHICIAAENGHKVWLIAYGPLLAFHSACWHKCFSVELRGEASLHVCVIKRSTSINLHLHAE
jgi:hypothetical protein